MATVALGKAGGANAALLAISILALSDGELKEKLVSYRQKMAEKVEESSRRLKEKI